MRESLRKRAFWLIVGLGLLARLLPLLLLPQGTRLTGDSSEYMELAGGLLEGRGYTRDLVAPYTPYLGRTPTYPLFIAAVWSLTGKGAIAISLAQSLLDAIVGGLVYLMARARFGERPALIAGLLYALLPFTVGTAGQVMSEAVCSFLFAVALLAHQRALSSSSRGLPWVLLSGVCWGGAVLARPYLGALVPLAGVLLVWEVRHTLRARASVLLLWGATLGAGFVLVMAPWVLRNWRVSRETSSTFVPLQLYGSRKPYTTMYTPGFMHFMASFDEPFVWTEAYKAPNANYLTKAEKLTAKRLFDDIKAHDGVVTPKANAEFERLSQERYASAPLRLHVWRPVSMVLKTWFSPRSGTFRVSRGMNADSAPRAMVAVFLVINAAFSLLGVAGIVRLLRRGRTSPINAAFLAFAPVVTTLVTVYLAMRESRLTVPLFPVTCVAAALGASWAGELLTARRAAKRGVAATTLTESQDST